MGIVTIRGKEYPVKTSESGREFIELDSLSDGGTLYDVMHTAFKGPFKAQTIDGKPLPPYCEWKLSDSGSGVLRLYIDSTRANIARVVDAEGVVVACDINYIAAYAIANALNKQPEGFKDGFETGLTCNSGMNRHLKENRFMFWTVMIKSVEYNPLDHSRVGYLSSLTNRYETPAVCSSPMSAIRFRSKQTAQRFIEIVNDIKKNCVQIVYDIEGNEKEPSYIKRWDWDSLEPVLIQFAYNVLK